MLADIEFQQINLDRSAITSFLMKRIEEKYPEKVSQIKFLLEETIEQPE